MTPIKNQKNSKRDDLQGIRGLAILAVLGFHFYPKQFPNGYLGVDQFFVLSGFLMCMLLTKSQKLPTLSFFTQFYLRRFKRILPLYFLFILCAVTALYTVFPTAPILQNQLSAGKALIFTSNRPHTEDEDYFEKYLQRMTPIKNQKNSKRDDLQGIRGLAILAVLGCHFYPEQFPNGYLGVDQFFVLSGFLMCMLLTKSQKLPTLSFFTQFYLRRFKRILPLYFLLILCAVTALYTVFPTAPILQNQLSAGKALIFTSNRPHTEDEDYFEKLSIAMDLFTHTWSLSVEIQFYFIVPFIFLIGLQLKGASRYVYYVCLSLLSFAFHASSATSVAFNSVFARIWQFSIGMISYFIVDNRYKSNTFFYKPLENAAKQEGPGLFVLVKYTVLIISMFIILITVEVTPLPARLSITTFTGILIVLDAEDLVLNSRFLIYIGDISYALYLIHWPIYAYVKLTYPANTWVLTSALIISIVLAILVHQTFERWYLRQSNNMIAILVVSLFFLNAIAINWYEIRENVDEAMKNYAVFSDKNDSRFDGVTPNMTLDDAEKMNANWNYYDIDDRKLFEPGCVHKFSNKKWCEYPGNGSEYKIAILGNSYVKNHLKLIIQECRNRATTFTTTSVSGCEPFAAPHIPVDNGRDIAKSWSPTCARQLTTFVDFIKTAQPDYAFIMSR